MYDGATEKSRWFVGNISSILNSLKVGENWLIILLLTIEGYFQIEISLLA